MDVTCGGNNQPIVTGSDQRLKLAAFSYMHILLLHLNAYNMLKI